MSKYLKNIVPLLKEKPAKTKSVAKKASGSKKARKKTEEK